MKGIVIQIFTSTISKYITPISIYVRRKKCLGKEVVFMKVIILAGGFGTRISEESRFKPKPMINLGGMPILWHIMKLYSYYGFNEFIICAGYKQHVIKEYFADYFLHTSDITYDFTVARHDF